MNRRIAFDIDGVITENVYIPKEERTCERYLELKPNRKVVGFIEKLSNDEGWYSNTDAAWKEGIVWISSRSCPCPKKCFWEWLYKNDLMPFNIAPKYFNVPKEQKAYLAQELGCAMLIDDSMEAIAECDNTVVKGILLVNTNPRRYKAHETVTFNQKHPETNLTYSGLLEKTVKNYFTAAGIAFESTP